MKKRSFVWLLAVMALLAVLSAPSAVRADGGYVVINEVQAGTDKAIEFYNDNSNPIDLSGWDVLVYNNSNVLAAHFTFPSGTSIASHEYIVLYLKSGTSAGNTYYLPNDPIIVWGGAGAVSLRNADDRGIDFMRFGSSITRPPIGTSWSGTNPSMPTNQNLGRDAFSTDTNFGSDWIAQNASLGAVNPAQQCYFLIISHTGKGSDPSAVPDRSSGCNAGYYHVNESISLSGAAPQSGWAIAGWSGSQDDASRRSSNTVLMPANAHIVSVIYAEMPPAPVLVTPVDKARSEAARPSFTWQVVSGAEKYTWEIKRIDDNTTVQRATYDAAVRCDAFTCEIPAPDDLPLGEYKWHVAAYVEDIIGHWSVYHQLHIIPPAPRLRSPGVDAVVYGGRPTFKWYPVADAQRYQVEVFNPDASQLGRWNVGTTCDVFCEFRLPFDLEMNYGDYTWQVNVMKWDMVSDWSAPRIFSYTRLARNTQLAPESGSTFAAQPVTFRWTAVTGAIYYQFQIENMAGVKLHAQLYSAAAHCNAGECEISVNDPKLTGGSEYRWHVRGKNGRNFAQWTPWWTFTLE
ncbi:MAG TPA: lamin tail domain-containing protein [Chloroflexi bacterium]|nr:lamin tail domain-containing protein [Chloroflexota bacterium]